MYLKYLRDSKDNLNSNSKYLLLKIIQIFGKNIILDKKTAELSKLFRMTPRQVSNGLHDLVHHKYLNKVVRPNGSGRPINRYNDTPKLKQYLSEFSRDITSPFPHKKIIDGLLNDGQLPKGKCVHSLKISQRLLLAVMLSRSDKCAVVRELGIANLSSLTGLSRDSVKAQLSVLVCSKYIASYTPGVTGKFLIGTAKTVYRLNLQHGNYAANDSSMDIAILALDENMNYLTASFIYKLAASLDKEVIKQLTNGHKLPDSLYEQFELIHEFFNETEMKEVIVYFQQRLDQYVSSLLTSHWDGLISTEVVDFISLMDQIEKETIPSKLMKDNVSDNFPSKEQREVLFKFVYGIAVHVAKGIANKLKVKTDLWNSSKTYNILNSIDQFGNHQLIIFSKA